MDKPLKPKTVFYTGPVTAVHALNEDDILVGMGSSVYRYRISQRTCVERLPDVLPAQSIHGIRQGNASESCLCIFGGKSFREIRFHGEGLSIASDIHEVEDWIWDMAFISKAGCSDEFLVVVMAHNTVLLYDRVKKDICLRCQCEENSILYCAKIIGTSWENLMVAAGTVYNQVLLWSPADTKNVASQQQVLHRLTGHQGVIFSVEFCHHRRCIYSVSDDRSIRIWKIEFLEDADLGDNLSLKAWKTCSSRQIHVLYGHSARVWDAKVLREFFVSIGEDSTCCVWSHDGKILQKFKGHKGKSIWSLAVEKTGLYAVFEGTLGVGDVFPVTGGGDNSVRVWHLNSISHNVNSNVKETMISLRKQDSNEEDFPRVVTMLSWNEVLVFTNQGKGDVYNLKTQQWKSIMDDTQFSSYVVMDRATNEKLLALGNLKGSLRIMFQSCDQNGGDNWVTSDHIVHDGKVFSVLWLNKQHLLTTGPEGIVKLWVVSVSPERIQIQHSATLFLPQCRHRWMTSATLTPDHSTLVCGDRGGTVHVYLLSESTENSEHLSPLQSFAQIHGKTGVTDVCYLDNHIYTTGRDGCYREFLLNEDGHLDLLHSNKVSKGFDWLDKMKLQSEDNNIIIYGFFSNSFVFWSTYNNQKLAELPCGGGHRSWDTCFHGNDLRFACVKSGDIMISETTIWSNQVILKDSLHGREVTNTCSLGMIHKGQSPIHLIATASEDTDIHLLSVSYNANRIMEMSKLRTLHGHVSSIRTLTKCQSTLPQSNKLQQKILLFSGGGRAQLCVWRVTVPCVSRGIATCVKALGDNAQESESETRSEEVGSYVTVENCVNHETLCIYMMDNWSKKKRKTWKNPEMKPNPETRFMDIDAVGDFQYKGANFCVLLAACSDGLIRLYHFDEEKQKLNLIEESEYHGRCVLKVKLFYHHIPTSNSNYLLCFSAATDGRIAMWNLTPVLEHYFSCFYKPDKQDVISESCTYPCNIKTNLVAKNLECSVNSDIMNEFPKQEVESHDGDTPIPNLKPVCCSKCNQSGINSLDVINCSESCYRLASGGDDNALFMTDFNISDDGHAVTISESSRYTHCNAHAAQITGLKFVSPEKLCSVSVDQRLCCWRLSSAGSVHIQLHQLWCKFVSVSDVSCLSVWDDDDADDDGKGRSISVLVSGMGLQLLQSKTF